MKAAAVHGPGLELTTTRRRPLEEINEAFRAMKAGEVAGTVLTA